MEDSGEHFSKVEEKKQIKRENLLSSAYTLFMKKGSFNTSINDIVEDAGVAKGTFYLYFEDKYDIEEKVIIEKSRLLFDEAVINTTNKKINDYQDKLINIFDYIINSLSKNKDLTELIGKYLYLGLFNEENNEDYIDIKKMLVVGLKQYNKKIKNPEVVLFMIVNLVSSVVYDSIIFDRPTNIESLKPVLFSEIKKMIQ